MATTVTQFSGLDIDGFGNHIPAASARTKLSCDAVDGGGTVDLLPACRLVRIATDTAVTCDISGGDGAGDPELFVPGVEFFVPLKSLPDDVVTLTIAAAV